MRSIECYRNRHASPQKITHGFFANPGRVFSGTMPLSALTQMQSRPFRTDLLPETGGLSKRGANDY
jgi:hypothetical protein